MVKGKNQSSPTIKSQEEKEQGKRKKREKEISEKGQVEVKTL
jgi:hypothetical protein